MEQAQKLSGSGRQSAVVIGASMAGLLAARALSDTFERVTLIERDRLLPPEEGRITARKGVPQGKQPHALLTKGRETLEAFFPGFTEELLKQGAGLIDPTIKLRWWQDGGYHQRYESGFMMLMATRLAIEAQVRKMTLALPNVSLIDSADAPGLAASEDCTRVTGVRLVRRGQAGEAASQEEILKADLVVDASGRGSKLTAWLESLGYDRPEEQEVQVKVTYVTRNYERKPGDFNEDWGIVFAPSVMNNAFAGMIGQEGGQGVEARWAVWLGGYFGRAPEMNDESFIEYARSLPESDIYDLIRDRPPLTPIIMHTYPASHRRYYERLKRFPEGLLVVGDAICSFNPAYGQGMTVAALEAEALRECLAEGTERLARRFFHQAARLIDIPWNTVVNGDLRFPETQGKRTPLSRVLMWYLGRLNLASQKDPFVSLAFFKVTNLVTSPLSLISPRMVWRVMRGSRSTP